MGRALLGGSARHHRLVPAPRSPRAPAERVRAAEGAARREGARATQEREMKYAVVQQTRLGARRMNQDRIGCWSSSACLLMAVADGLGGHLHGEVAAELAIALLGAAFAREARPRIPEPGAFLSRA